jgi:hypothetical protein
MSGFIKVPGISAKENRNWATEESDSEEEECEYINNTELNDIQEQDIITDTVTKVQSDSESEDDEEDSQIDASKLSASIAPVVKIVENKKLSKQELKEKKQKEMEDLDLLLNDMGLVKDAEVDIKEVSPVVENEVVKKDKKDKKKKKKSSEKKVVAEVVEDVKQPSDGKPIDVAAILKAKMEAKKNKSNYYYLIFN